MLPQQWIRQGNKNWHA